MHLPLERQLRENYTRKGEVGVEQEVTQKGDAQSVTRGWFG